MTSGFHSEGEQNLSTILASFSLHSPCHPTEPRLEGTHNLGKFSSSYGYFLMFLNHSCSYSQHKGSNICSYNFLWENVSLICQCTFFFNEILSQFRIFHLKVLSLY